MAGSILARCRVQKPGRHEGAKMAFSKMYRMQRGEFLYSGLLLKWGYKSDDQNLRVIPERKRARKLERETQRERERTRTRERELERERERTRTRERYITRTRERENSNERERDRENSNERERAISNERDRTPTRERERERTTKKTVNLSFRYYWRYNYVLLHAISFLIHWFVLSRRQPVTIMVRHSSTWSMSSRKTASAYCLR